MDANAWITLAGVVSAFVVGLLGLIVKGTWSISGKLTTVNIKLASVEEDLKSVCDDVGSTNRKLDAQARQLTDTNKILTDHVSACDDDRRKLKDQIAAVT